MEKPQDLFGPMRLPFLLLPPVCVALGTGTAVWTGDSINLLYLLLIFVGALAAHISVNALNEYFDFRSGLDLRTQRTPFSGGSGTLPARPQAARLALSTGLVSLAIAALIGLFFLFVRGWGLLPLGLLGLVVIVIYTPWMTRQPLLCLVAPGLGFGPFMVMGTDFCLSGSYTWPAFFASLVPFFLVSNLLLLNQFPDVDADRSVGRDNLPIALGFGHSLRVYGLFALLAYLSLGLGVLSDLLPSGAMLALATLPLALLVVAGTQRAIGPASSLIPAILPSMGLNVLLTLITPALLSLGTLLGP